ncbi:hypothetical protein QKQ25_gp129 [Hyphantria cunea granulovirus]|uniref:Chitin-binding type-2 domain-containing protein n=1 Tax=Hyphantria cunea granulovirus TaxID=307448 RepID=A0AAE6D070_9BBAC|nr:hypothetical protein QKQ25_gp129 [Hyphantria cunea granulovirus]QBQ01682.1 hypothetical protein HycuGV_00129 [Hyphantria cunea granulovirus]
MNKYVVLFTITLVTVITIFTSQNVSSVPEEPQPPRPPIIEADMEPIAPEDPEYIETCQLGFWGYLPHPVHCFKFIFCAGDRKFLRTCPYFYAPDEFFNCVPIPPGSSCVNIPPF